MQINSMVGLMSNIYDALAALQAAIREIASKEETLEFSMSGLENNTLAQKNFVERTLISNNKSLRSLIPNNLPSSADNNLYTAGVIQALWNIAHCASQGYVYATYWYNKDMKASLDYLGQDWVPKIINSKTFKLGKALQHFLEIAQQDESINEIPVLTGQREPVKKLLEKANTLLTKRLKVYELHTNKAKESALECIRNKQTQLKDCNDIIAQVEKARLDAEQGIDACDVDFLEGDAAQEKKLLELKEAEGNFTSKVQAALKQYKNWSNTYNELPDSMEVSDFLLALSEKPLNANKVVSLWQELYNDANLAIKILPIKPDVIIEVDNAIELISTTSKAITARIGAKILELEKKIQDQKVFHAFEQELKALVLTIPVFVNDDNLNNAVDYVPTDPQNYQNKLVSYQNELTTHKDKLQQALTLLEPTVCLPTLNNPELTPYFEGAIAQAKQDIESGISATNIALASNKNKIRDNGWYQQEQKIINAKKSVTGENDLLTEERLAIIKIEVDVLIPLETELRGAKIALESFEQSYPHLLSDIENQFKTGENSLFELGQKLDSYQIRIEDQERIINDLNSKIVKRGEFLSSALSTLDNYRKILDAHKGPYVPRAEIPQNQLVEFLESNSKELEDLYTIESKWSILLGLNQSNAYTNYLYYTSSTNHLKEGLNALRKRIDDKIQAIQTEQKEHLLPNNGVTPLEGSLKRLAQTLQEHQDVKTKLELEEKPLKELHAQLTEQKNSQINDLNKKLSEHKDAVTRAEKAVKFAGIELELAHIVRYWYALAFKLMDVEFEQRRMTFIAKNLEEKSVIDAMEYLDTMRSYIPTLRSYIPTFKASAMMTLKVGAKSGYDLLADISLHLSSLEKLLREIQPLTESEQEMLGNYREQFNYLSTKKNTIADKITGLVENDPAYTALEKRVGILTAMEQLLIIKNRLNAEDSKEIDALSALIKTNKEELAKVNWLDNDPVKAEYLEVSALIDKLSDKLLVMQLARAQTEINQLLSRFATIKTKPQKQHLLADVDAFILREKSITYNQAGTNGLTIQKAELEKKYKALTLLDNLLEETEEETKARRYKEALSDFRKDYLGQANDKRDIFSTYLEERALTHWLKDYFRSAIALFLGCINYKTDAQLREEYINNTLKPAIRAFVDADATNQKEKHEALISVIENGKKTFVPRVKDGNKGWSNSLAAKLTGLAEKLEDISVLQLALEEKNIENTGDELKKSIQVP